MTVYGVCIFVANMVLAFKHYTHTCLGIIFFLMCNSAYFLFFYLFSASFKNEIGSLFVPTFSIRMVYLIIFFIVFSVYLGELAYSGCKRIWKGDDTTKGGEHEELLKNR